MGAGEEEAFAFDQVLFMNKLLEGRRDMLGVHDSPCPEPGRFGTSPFQWHQTDSGWTGQLYEFAGIPAASVRCVDIHGSLVAALREPPFADARSVVLLNANFQMGYGYRENTRQLDRHYWPVRSRMVFKSSLWERAERFAASAFAASEGRYLAVHWRRGDFVEARRPDVVKTAAEVAPRIKALLKAHELHAVYLATGPDTTARDLRELRAALDLPDGAVVRYRKGNEGFEKAGVTTLALMDQMLCAMGAVFIGTKTSLFTATIMEERELRGLPFSSTKLEFGDE